LKPNGEPILGFGAPSSGSNTSGQQKPTALAEAALEKWHNFHPTPTAHSQMQERCHWGAAASGSSDHA